MIKLAEFVNSNVIRILRRLKFCKFLMEQKHIATSRKTMTISPRITAAQNAKVPGGKCVLNSR